MGLSRESTWMEKLFVKKGQSQRTQLLEENHLLKEQVKRLTREYQESKVQWDKLKERRDQKIERLEGILEDLRREQDAKLESYKRDQEKQWEKNLEQLAQEKDRQIIEKEDRIRELQDQLNDLQIAFAGLESYEEVGSKITAEAQAELACARTTIENQVNKMLQKELDIRDLASQLQDITQEKEESHNSYIHQIETLRQQIDQLEQELDAAKTRETAPLDALPSSPVNSQDHRGVVAVARLVDSEYEGDNSSALSPESSASPQKQEETLEDHQRVIPAAPVTTRSHTTDPRACKQPVRCFRCHELGHKRSQCKNSSNTIKAIARATREIELPSGLSPISGVKGEITFRPRSRRGTVSGRFPTKSKFPFWERCTSRRKTSLSFPPPPSA